MDRPGKVWLGVLGPLEVTSDGRAVDLPAGQVRTLLASLLVAFGRPVLMDDLAERLWPDRMPVRVRATVYTYVARLRGLLGHDLIRTTAGGAYLIAAEPEQVDLWRFRDLLAAARRAGSAEAELALLRDALRLWRGQPFHGMESAWLTREVVPGLVDEWFAAVERRIDLESAHADPGAVVAELRDLVASGPTRESLWLRLIEALRQSGRRVEALDAYQQIRAALADEFGIDPGDALQRLHRAILVEGVGQSDAAPPVPAPAGPVRQLPHDIVGFCGRSELEQLNRLRPEADGDAAQPTTVVAIDGAPGVGKTTIAVHWAHRIAHAYPDVQLYLNLRGYGPGEPVSPSAAAETLLRALGVPTEAIPAATDERSALLRSVVASRRTLLLLDDARDAEQVRPLLPGGDSLVVITSRSQLRGLSIRDGARRVTLDRLPVDEALAMLASTVGADRVAAEPVAAGRLVDLCDRLPLALAIVAERASRADSLREVVHALLDEKARLDVFGAGEDDPHTDLRAALSWSYRALDGDAAAMFRKLGLHPCNDIGLEAAAALADLSTRQVGRSLDRLAAAHLVEHRRAQRFEVHDLIRRYATERAEHDEPAADRTAAVRRMLDWYLHTAVSADNTLMPHRVRDFVAPYEATVPVARFATTTEALAWFEREYQCLRTVVDWAAGNGWVGHAWRIAMAMTTFFDAVIPWQDGTEFYDSVLRAAERAAEHAGQAYLLNSLGCIFLDREDWHRAAAYFRRSLARFQQVEHARGMAMVLGNHGRAQGHIGDHERARRDIIRAINLYRQLRSRRGVAQNLDNLGTTFARSGAQRRAIVCFLQASEITREIGDTHTLAMIQHQLGLSYAAIGEMANAIHAFRESIAAFHEIGIRRWEALVLVDLGKAVHQAGHPGLARQVLAAALTTLTWIGDPRSHEISAIVDGAQPT
ncbi:AfsR/SARP family transcriptional regulator [Virgisporangium aurantiacum]|uniref:SARP family transcriptional regulator n=1 Tax=Virgisporangium aurantiacum TaxID=175570 RepID=A0A8J4E6U1_9ACTN|nr:BTAD domain-containing putative transcriptional regulator [Virgisporangium aurantiacum]GIJ61182.1 SARP family transcriptional regulator [Virgisporangium aurantiacum]